MESVGKFLCKGGVNLMYIANNAALKVAYEELIFWENNPRLKDNALINDRIIKKLKERIRDYFRRINQRTGRLVKSDPDGDGEIWLEELPETVKTEQAAEDWFLYHKYREATPSPYDCTGQLFTAWYKIFKRNEKYVVYHCICRDV